jgi:queuine tRNA-ribosyltransferase
LGATLLSWHNLHYYQDLMRGIRGAIAEGDLETFAEQFTAEQAAGDMDPI